MKEMPEFYEVFVLDEFFKWISCATSRSRTAIEREWAKQLRIKKGLYDKMELRDPDGRALETATRNKSGEWDIKYW